MSTNHLIIGLGATGGKIIRALRKTLFQEYRGRCLERVNLALALRWLLPMRRTKDAKKTAVWRSG